jgi:formylglycine-generating enzyme
MTSPYAWRGAGGDHELRLIHVAGTAGRPFSFGAPAQQRPIEIRDFHMMTTPVTQALWVRVMGTNPSGRTAPRSPVENVSWDHLTGPDGFIQRINESDIRDVISGAGSRLRFRLPSETEWEYAARGGSHWTDGLTFSGSHDINAVAWYGRRWSIPAPYGTRMFPRRTFGGLFPTRTHDVATKRPNQLGLYDMCGNVWEWCEDACVDDMDVVPRDGSAWRGDNGDRRLRGGCHHNWPIHCTVWFRYGIARDAHDGCIGFRLVLA